MKKNLLFCFYFFISFWGHSQSQIAQNLQKIQAEKTAVSLNPFVIYNSPTAQLKAVLKSEWKPSFLQMDTNILEKSLAASPELLTLTLPATADSTVLLDLMKVELFASDFKLTTQEGKAIPMNRGLHYQGVIRGARQSLVAISIIDGELSGVIAHEKGNSLVEQVRGSTNLYAVFDERALTEPRPTFNCGVQDEGRALNTSEVLPVSSIGCKVVGLFFEADYHMYQTNGSSVTNVANYVARMFNQVALLYNNENLAIRINELTVWTVSDPYVGYTSTSSLLSAYRSTRRNFNGQLAHLLSTRDLGGGIAFLDVLCNTNTNINYAVSANLGLFGTFPNYSWPVNVVAHEMGHNFGSPHTHSCTWPGGAIDNCGIRAGYSEGSCTGPTPTNGGTVMSYCHLLSDVGIKFLNGFGELPGNLMRNRVSSKSCFVISNDPPTSLSVESVGTTNATLTWVSTSGSTSFTAQYRPTGTTNWTTTGTILGVRTKLTGLNADVVYEWRVKGECGDTYSAIATFRTGQAVYCTPTYYYNGCDYGIGISSVTINGNVVSSNSGCSTNYYRFFNTPEVSLCRGNNTFQLDLLGYYNGQQIAIWIDFNNDYEFSDAEVIYATTSAQRSAIVASFSIPNNVTAGLKRMRIRNQFSNKVTDPCGTLGYGETEDYVVNIIPTPVISASGNTTICRGSNLTLTAQGCTAYRWSNNQTTASITVSPTTNTTFTAQCTNATCQSPISNAIAVTVNAVPEAPSIAAEYCSGPKLDSDKLFGGTLADSLRDMLVTSTNQYLFAGSSLSANNGDKSENSRGANDFWVVKTDSTFQKIWDKRFGGTGEDFLTSITQTSNNEYLLAGSSLSGLNGDKSQASQGGLDYWLVKTNSSGTKIWDKRFGGTASDSLQKVLQSGARTWLLGSSNSGIGGDKSQASLGQKDYWVIKIDNNGQKILDKTIGGTSQDELAAALVSLNGQLVLVGKSLSGIGGHKTQDSRGASDFWVVKLDSNGTKIWDKRFGGTAQDIPTSVVTSADGGFVIGGYSASALNGDKSEASRGGFDYWVVKIDSAGTKIWDKRFGGSGNDYLSSIAVASDGGFVLTGSSDSPISGDKSQGSKGLTDYWLVKIDANGTKIWDIALGGSGNDNAYTIVTTKENDFVVGGASASSLSGDKSEASKGLSDFWLLKIKDCHASTGSICEGMSLKLVSNGCNGVVNWSVGGTGLTKIVTPNTNTTFTATCTEASCVSASSSGYGITVNNSMYSVASGNWQNVAVWSCGRLPVVTDDVTVSQGHTVEVLNNKAAAKNIIQIGNVLFTNSGKLQIKGSID